MARARELALLASLVACASAATETPSAFPALDATAQARRYRAMQEALERSVNGQTMRWTENEHVYGKVVPVETMRTALYGWCRDYEELISTSTENHRLVGIACRTSEGQWLVVDIRSYRELPSRNAGERPSSWSGTSR